MATSSAKAEWSGDLKEGAGTISLGSHTFFGAYSFGSRFEGAQGTSPEELLAAAHAGCFTMALALMLGEAGYRPTLIRTTAQVTIDKVGDSYKISKSVLETAGNVPGVDEATFAKYANMAKGWLPPIKGPSGQRSLDARLDTALASR